MCYRQQCTVGSDEHLDYYMEMLCSAVSEDADKCQVDS